MHRLEGLSRIGHLGIRIGDLLWLRLIIHQLIVLRSVRMRVLVIPILVVIVLGIGHAVALIRVGRVFGQFLLYTSTKRIFAE